MPLPQAAMKSGLTAATVGLAAFASANGAMGYALEQYDPTAWLAYVVLTVALEAWKMGRWAGFGWPASVGVSLVANFVTAFCCATLCGVGLHGSFVGSRLNPNPIMNMIVMFTGFAVISGAIEAIVWRVFDRRPYAALSDSAWVLRSLKVHLMWVPFGIAIMLVPARPYPMLEGYTFFHRRRYMQGVASALSHKILETERIPDYRDTERLFREIVPKDEEPDTWVVPYRPMFSRFSTGQTKGELLWEWNPAASGLKITSEKMPGQIWLLRTKPDSGWKFGLVWTEEGVRATGAEKALGYR